MIAVLLAVLTPLLAHLNVWIIRTIYTVGNSDVYTKQWHQAQWFVLVAIWLYALTVDWQIAIIWPWYHWVVFDGLINRYALQPARSWFYVGHSSSIDKWLQTMAYPERNAMVMKITALAISSVPIIIHYL